MSKIYFGTILLILHILFISCDESSFPSFDFSTLKGVRITNEAQIAETLNSTDMTFFAFYYKKNSESSNQVATIFSQIQHKLEFFAETMLIDCDLESLIEVAQCKNNGQDEDKFVFFEVYEPPVYKFNPYTKAMNTHTKKLFTKDKVSENILFNFITQNIVSRAQKVTNENYDLFVSNANMNKFILFTDKSKTPLLFRGLSNYFYDQISFGEVSSKEKDLISKLKIEKFPTLMLYQSHEDGVIIDDPHTEIYKGENTAKAIVEYLKEFALKEKLYKTSKNKSNTNSQFDLYFRKLNPNQIEEYVEKNKDKGIVFYFDNSQSEKDKKSKTINYSLLTEDIKEFNSQAHGFFKFAYVDCSGDNDKLCNSDFKFDEYPATILLKAKKTEKDDNDEEKEVPYADAKERIKKGQILLSKEYSDIKKEINSIYEGNIRDVNQHTINSVLSESITKNKVPIIYMFDSYVQMGISLISLEEKFKNLFDWIVYDNPPEDFMKSLNLQKLPALAIAIPDDRQKGAIKMMLYNDIITYSKVKAFLEQTFKFEYKEQKQDVKDTGVKNEPILDFVQTTDDLVKTCSKKKLCMIAFFDMRTSQEEIVKEYEKKFEIYKNVSESSAKRPVAFAYVNGTCQSEFGSKFGIDAGSLPNLVLYSYNKDVFANFVGAFMKEDIEDFITKTVSGRANFQKMQKENAVLSDIKCEEIHEVEVQDDDDDIMKELLEEERKKREALEAEMGKDEKKKKKKKKKKSKKKKEDL